MGPIRVGSAQAQFRLQYALNQSEISKEASRTSDRGRFSAVLQHDERSGRSGTLWHL